MSNLEYIVLMAAAIGLGLLFVSIRVLSTLQAIRRQQAQSAADATQALIEKLDELYDVDAVLAGAKKLSESVQATAGGSKELVLASMHIVQATYATLSKQTAAAMVTTRALLSSVEEQHAKYGHYETSIERCRNLLAQQQRAHKDLAAKQQELLSEEFVLG